MANGNGRIAYRVYFVHETPRRDCENALENLACRLERFHKRARAATVSIKPKNVDAVLAALEANKLVTSVCKITDGKE
jgi:hypothetical protein